MALLDFLDGLGRYLKRHQSLQGRFPVGLGIQSIGFRLIGFALGHAIVLNQFLIQIGEAPGGLRRGDGLAVGTDSGREIRGVDDRKRSALLDAIAQGHEQA